MRQESSSPGHRKPLTTALLAVACAGMLTPTAAQGTPFVETTDFGNSFATRNTTIPPGTHSVSGTLTNPGDFTDFFTLFDLPANQPLTLRYSASTTVANSSLNINVFNDSGGFLGSTFHFVQPGDGVVSGSWGITVPANGAIVAGVDFSESGAGVLSYTLAVPEPSTAAILGGLGALALLGRRRSYDRKDETHA
jgi:hypothetical protein